ncbi:lipocalin family protein [Ideonella livida]|uniref:Outer membrane lipoprotein Blc n=1 Tax=Ideonella livida TaxID=2707176 RepID=A0A7C9TLB7_9BURK|nr:lipocalin family protein [Ideonella livida]NDY91487.1 lipocalin family protein [Ideonella livida]
MSRNDFSFLTRARRAAGGLVLGSAAILAGCASAPTAPLPTVAQVDLDRYLGRWHQVALVPNRFQAQCVGDTTAEYRRDGAAVEVRNRCRRADGGFDEAVGVAQVVPDSGNAKLRVSFFRPFYGDYWILALDPDYRWVLVGEPRREYGWILSRSPQLPAADLEAALARAEALGWRRSQFQVAPGAVAPR